MRRTGSLGSSRRVLRAFADGAVAIAAEGFGGGGADGGVLVVERGDERVADGGGLLLRDLLDGEDAGAVAAVFVDVLVGGDAEAEGPEQHGGSLQGADAGEGAGVVEVLVGGVQAAVDQAGVGAAFAVDDGEQDVFAGVVVPSSRGWWRR